MFRASSFAPSHRPSLRPSLLPRSDLFSHFGDRYVKISANDLRPGIYIDYKGKYLEIVDAIHVKKGRGSAFVQTEVKEILSGKKYEMRLRSAEDMEKLYIETQEMSLDRLEDDGNTLVFADDYDNELSVPISMIPEDRRLYMTEGVVSRIKVLEKDDGETEILDVSVPDTVEADIVEWGLTASNNKFKKAILSNGKSAMVPPFLNIGDRIIVRTEDDSYVERVE